MNKIHSVKDKKIKHIITTSLITF